MTRKNKNNFCLIEYFSRITSIIVLINVIKCNWYAKSLIGNTMEHITKNVMMHILYMHIIQCSHFWAKRFLLHYGCKKLRAKNNPTRFWCKKGYLGCLRPSYNFQQMNRYSDLSRNMNISTLYILWILHFYISSYLF